MIEVIGVLNDKISSIYIIWALKLLKDTKNFKCFLRKDFKLRQEGYDNILVYVTDALEIPKEVLA